MFIPIGDRNNIQRFPIFTMLLIVVNVFVFTAFTLLYSANEEIANLYVRFAFVPAYFTHGLFYETVATSIFLHASWAHLIGNMLFLWTFGQMIEDALGHLGFLTFYLICGVAGSFAHYVTGPDSLIPLVGASGAISGIVGAYFIGFPRQKIRVVIPPLFFLPFRVRALSLLFLWAVFQTALGFLTLQAGETGVAYWAHVGGFAAGSVLFLLLRLMGRAQPYSETQRVMAEQIASESHVDIRDLRKSRQP